MAVGLLTIPFEILHSILVLVPPEDLASIARSCRSLYHFLDGNNALFRDIYLHRLVRAAPSSSSSTPSPSPPS